MPGASGGLHGHGVSALDPLDPLDPERFFVAAGNGGESGV